jgi:ABC-type protease/lipase transport system fused ATPase/permease subunit
MNPTTQDLADYVRFKQKDTIIAIFEAAYMVLATIFVFVNMTVGLVFTILFLALFVIELRTDKLYEKGEFPKARVIRQNEKKTKAKA